MKRTTGTYVTSTTLGESVQAFVPHPLPPARPKEYAIVLTQVIVAAIESPGR